MASPYSTGCRTSPLVDANIVQVPEPSSIIFKATSSTPGSTLGIELAKKADMSALEQRPTTAQFNLALSAKADADELLESFSALQAGLNTKASAQALDMLTLRIDDVADMQAPDLSGYARTSNPTFGGTVTLPNSDNVIVGTQSLATVLTDDIGRLNFSTRLDQKLNLFGSLPYGIGVQNSNLYFRTDAGFQWYYRGSHAADASDAANGKRILSLSSEGDLRVVRDLHVTGTANLPAISSINVGTTTLVDAIAAVSMPIGGIIMWSGAVAPSGWALCNGQNGTPNLVNRFIVGAGDLYTTNQTGGSADAVVVSHNHSMDFNTGAGGAHGHTTTSTGEHFHDIRLHNAGQLADNDGDREPLIEYRIPGQFDRHLDTRTNNSAHSHTISGQGDHTHRVNGATAYNGATGTNANLPPYYALAYIMRVT